MCCSIRHANTKPLRCMTVVTEEVRDQVLESQLKKLFKDQSAGDRVECVLKIRLKNDPFGLLFRSQAG